MSESKLDDQTVIREILDSSAILFHDQFKDAYIAPDGNGNRIIKINSKDFKHWLAAYCWRQYGEVLSAIKVNNIIQMLSGHAAYQGAQYELSVRCAYYDNALWYDCGNAAVRVDKNGWTIVKEPPILFRRYSHQKIQDLPQRGGELYLLGNYANLSRQEDLTLLLVYTVAAFIPNFPHPLLIFHGAQGSGKSASMRALKELIDPSVIRALSSPRETALFAQLAQHHAFLSFDNLSGIPLWLSDALARASTGDGFSKRAHYTDDDDVIYTFLRPIALNGINQVVTKPDLLDRSILLGLKRIDPTVRSADEDIWTAFYNERPLILGAIFDTISKAFEIYPNVKLNTLPRMADFTRWGFAIAEAAGIGGDNFVTAYRANINRQDDEAIDNSPVAQALIEFMRDKNDWKGTAADLLQQLKRISFYDDLQSSPLWPRDPQWLTKRVKEMETTLQNKGIRIDRYMSDMKRITHITKTATDHSSKTVETVNNETGIENITDADILDNLSKIFPD